jgi:hypothetical protein
MADRPTCSSRTATRAEVMSRPDLVVYLDSLVAAEVSRSRWSGRPSAGPPHSTAAARWRPAAGPPRAAARTATPARHPPPQHPRPPGRSRPDRAAAGPAPPGPDPRPHPTPPRPAGRPGSAVLGDRYERQAVLVERHVAAAQHPHALPAGDGGQPLGQPALADSRLPADHRYQRRAVGGMGQELAQPRQLLAAADETARGDLVGHAGPIMPRPVLRRVGRGSEDPR